MTDKPILQKSQVTVGLGTLDISFNLPVPLYLSENDEQPFDILSFKRKFNGVMLFKTNHLDSLKPYRISGGDSNKEAAEHVRHGLIRFPAVLSFRVLEATNDFYRIVVNEKTFETAVIKKDSAYAVLSQRDLFGVSVPKHYKGCYIYETWEHLLKRAVFVDFDRVNYAVYDAPNGNKIFENENLDSLPYNVTEVCGDWMKVKKGFRQEHNFEGIENAEGWVKWKNDKEITVRIIEYSVE